MARRRSSTPRKSITKSLPVKEATEDDKAEKSENLLPPRPTLTSEPTSVNPQGKDADGLARNPSIGQASVPNQRDSNLVLPPKRTSLLSAHQEIEGDLNRTGQTDTSLPKRASFSERANETHMARAYGKYQGVKDTPNHLYGLDGAALTSDEDADIEVDDCFNRGRISSDSWYEKVQGFTKAHWSKAISYFSVLLITGILLSVILQVYPHFAVSRSAETENNSETLRKIEEKVDRLSSVLQVIANSADSSADGKSVISEQAVQQIVQEALERYSADKVGMADFALESSGAQIHSSYHSATYDIGAARVVVFGIPLWFDVKPPRVILQPDNSPGNCWAFKGDQGFVVVKLSKMLMPTAFSLEHIPKLLSPTGDGRIPSAPKEFTVWGWKDPDGNERVKLGYYTYNNEGDFLQTFNVQLVDGSEIVQYIELRILSNHGNPEYTCVYRFRVHGIPQ